MSLTGDIQTFSLSAIGRLLHQEKKTGILKVRSGRNETKIYFRAGDIVFISGALAAELSLGALLKEKNLVTDDEIEDSLGIARKTNKRLGVVLVESGFVSQDKLVQVLNYQFKEVISAVLTWREGVFAYADGLEGFVEDIRLKLDPIRLVAEAEKWKAYRSLIPNDHVVFQIKEGALRSGSFSTDGVLRVMLLIDGKRDVSQIIAETGLPRLGVYRAMAALAAQNAIETSVGTQASKTGGALTHTIVVQFYLDIVHEITATIALELGEKKANSMLTRSLKRSPVNEVFLSAVVPGEDPTESTRLVCERLQQGTGAMDSNQLELEFRRTVLRLLQEQYHVLGFKASLDTLGKLVDIAEHIQDGPDGIADRAQLFFKTLLQDEQYFTGEKTFTEKSDLQGDTGSDHGNLMKNMENVGGAAIIAFYSRTIQIVMREMEADIGSKADTLLTRILKKSDYYDKFMSQYRVKDDIQANVNRIREHISREGYRLGKSSFISGFQQTLTELLVEKKQLLGEKSARATILSLENYLSAIAQKEYRPLTIHLIMTLKSIF
ncbi:MAG: DUF4388 domain-containing protein [Deltaproteobacteria bacterium]|nr:DUF4388 domain-containing protein [Deltaproteobacteria bacterium]